MGKLYCINDQGSTPANLKCPDLNLILLFFLKGETPLHTACRSGLAALTVELLQQGANPNLQTRTALPDAADRSQGVSQQSPLHMAIVHNHSDVVSVILEQKGMLGSVLM